MQSICGTSYSHIHFNFYLCNKEFCNETSFRNYLKKQQEVLALYLQRNSSQLVYLPYKS